MSARRRLLRPGAWLALLALVSSLLAPLATDARAAALDEALSLAVCGSAGGAGPTEPAPPPGHHRGDPGCVNCLSGPAALPLLHDAGRVHATACTPLRIALRTAPRIPGSGPWPPLPARGPPARG